MHCSTVCWSWDFSVKPVLPQLLWPWILMVSLNIFECAHIQKTAMIFYKAVSLNTAIADGTIECMIVFKQCCTGCWNGLFQCFYAARQGQEVNFSPNLLGRVFSWFYHLREKAKNLCWDRFWVWLLLQGYLFCSTRSFKVCELVSITSESKLK